MKGKTMKLSLLWLLLPMALVSSCNKTGVVTGESVRFSVGLVSDDTRTAYSNYTYKVGSQAKERIDWIANDLVTVFSPQAITKINEEDTHYSDYKVVSVSTHKEFETDDKLMSHATVEAADGGKGLCWEEGTNNFYAMYPSAATVGFTPAEKNWIGLNNTTMKGTIPSAQTFTWGTFTPDPAAGDPNVYFKGTPDMKYAWMFAKQTGEKGDSEVNLVFRPKFTAFEFTIGSGENASVTLQSFRLETEAAGAFLAGNFSIAGSSDAETVTVSSTGATSYIDVTFPVGTKVTQATASAPAKELTFTVFALPVDITSLKITFTGTEIQTRTLSLLDGSGDPLSFTACKKYRIRGLRFPNLLTAQGEDILWDLDAYGEGLNWY